MAQFIDKLEEDFKGFFEKPYTSKQGLVIKVNGKNNYGQVTIKEDGKTEIELQHKHSYEVNEIKVDKDLKVKSTGALTLVGQANLDKFLKGTTFKDTINYDTQHSTYDVKLSLESRYYEKLASRFDFQYFKGGEWNFKPNFAFQHCSKLSLLLDFNYNGIKKEVNEVNFGLLHSPHERMQTMLLRKLVGKVGSIHDLRTNGHCILRSRFTPRDFTTLGFDYIYNVKDKTSAMLMAVETKLQDGFTVRGKIFSGGDLETSATVALNEKWNMTLSAGTNASGIAGKHISNVGIKFEGFL